MSELLGQLRKLIEEGWFIVIDDSRMTQGQRLRRVNEVPKAAWRAAVFYNSHGLLVVYAAQNKLGLYGLLYCALSVKEATELITAMYHGEGVCVVMRDDLHRLPQTTVSGLGNRRVTITDTALPAPIVIWE
jgi:hypothetical protein